MRLEYLQAESVFEIGKGLVHSANFPLGLNLLRISVGSEAVSYKMVIANK